MKVWPATLVSSNHPSGRGSISEHVVITWPREIPPAAALRMRIATHGCACTVSVCVCVSRCAYIWLEQQGLSCSVSQCP